MTNITKYPLIDGFETTLAQERDGSTGLVYLNTLPEFTFPAGVTTYIVANPGKTKMQLGEIDSFDPVAKTANVVSITVEKGAGVDYTQQSHSVGSIVRISDNYAFWDHIKTAVNSKVDRNDEDIKMYKFADATARDAELTSPVNGESVYLTSEGKRTDYVGGSRVDRATGTTPNASETVAGKVEIATSGEFTAGTDTGGTGAKLVALPSQIKAKNDAQDSSIATNAGNISTNSTNIGTNTSNIATAQGKQVQSILQTTRLTSAATGTVSIAHGLAVTPSWCEVKAIARTTTSVSSYTESFSFGFSDGSVNRSSFTGTIDGGSQSDRTAGNDASNSVNVSLGDSGGTVTQKATITFDATNVNIVRTKGLTGSEPTAVTIYLTLLVHG